MTLHHTLKKFLVNLISLSAFAGESTRWVCLSPVWARIKGRHTVCFIHHLNGLLLLLSQNGSINPRCFTAYSFVCGFQQGLSSNIHSFFNHLSLVHPYLVLGHLCMWLVNFWKCAVYVNQSRVWSGAIHLSLWFIQSAFVSCLWCLCPSVLTTDPHSSFNSHSLSHSNIITTASSGDTTETLEKLPIQM